MRVIKDKYWWQARRREEKEFAEVQEKVNKPLFDEGGNALKYCEGDGELQVAEDDKMVAKPEVPVASATTVADSLVASGNNTVANDSLSVAGSFGEKLHLQELSTQLQNSTSCKTDSGLQEELHTQKNLVADLNIRLQAQQGQVDEFKSELQFKNQRIERLEDRMSDLLKFPNENKILAELNKQKTLAERLERVAIMFEDESLAKTKRIQELENKLDQMVRQFESISSSASPKLIAIDQEELKISYSTITSDEKLAKGDPKTKDFLIDWTSLVPAVILALLACLGSWFVAIQTAPLYESLEFPVPKLTSYAALALGIGFAAYAAATGKKIGRVLMLVMFCYELLLVVSGTEVNQADLLQEALKANPSYYLALETLDLTKDDYEQKKARYEDQNSQVYQNSWFKRKVLAPAHEKYIVATESLEVLRSRLSSEQPNEYLHFILKAIFRLCAIVLTVMLAESAIMMFMKSVRISHRPVTLGV